MKWRPCVSRDKVTGPAEQVADHLVGQLREVRAEREARQGRVAEREEAQGVEPPLE
jgi:hypothetical protein